MVTRLKGDDEYEEPERGPGAQKVPEEWQLLPPIHTGVNLKTRLPSQFAKTFPALPSQRLRDN